MKPHPYPTYRPSGIKWLGDVPEHWEVVPLKRWVGVNEAVLPETTESSFEFAYLEIGVVSNGQLAENPHRIRFSDAPSRARRIVRQKDTIISTVRTYLKAVWFADRVDDHLICSTGFAVLTPREGTDPKFVSYLVRSEFFTDRVTAESIGMAYPAISEGRLSSFDVCVPPLPEQRAIVRYLDHADSRIQRYVSAKQRLIELLTEQKQATINQAVTRGLDPNVPLKPSGVEWLGDVPAHWEVVALRYLATNFGSGVTPRGGASVYQEEGIPFLRSQNVHFDGLRLENVARITPQLHNSLSGTHVRPGDVLLNITGASIGRVCSVPDDFRDGNVNQHVCIIRPRQNVLLSRFLAAFLSTPGMQREIQMEQSGASREGLTLDSIRTFKIAVPPVEEQCRILQEVSSQVSCMDEVVSRARRQIDLMQEYRTRLIADVVTGKLDVREAADSLPMDDLPSEERPAEHHLPPFSDVTTLQQNRGRVIDLGMGPAQKQDQPSDSRYRV